MIKKVSLPRNRVTEVSISTITLVNTFLFESIVSRHKYVHVSTFLDKLRDSKKTLIEKRFTNKIDRREKMIYEKKFHGKSLLHEIQCRFRLPTI